MIKIDNFGIGETNGQLQLFRWREAGTIQRGANKGQQREAGWEAMECYPHDMAHALRIIIERHGVVKTNDNLDLASYAKWFEDMLNGVCRVASEQDQLARN